MAHLDHPNRGPQGEGLGTPPPIPSGPYNFNPIDEPPGNNLGLLADLVGRPNLRGSSNPAFGRFPGTNNNMGPPRLGPPLGRPAFPPPASSGLRDFRRTVNGTVHTPKAEPPPRPRLWDAVGFNTPRLPGDGGPSAFNPYRPPPDYGESISRILQQFDEDQERLDKLIAQHLGQLERCIIQRDQVGRKRMDYIRAILKPPPGPGNSPTSSYVGVSWSRTWNKVLGVRQFPQAPSWKGGPCQSPYDPASPTRGSPPSGVSSVSSSTTIPKLTIKLVPKPTCYPTSTGGDVVEAPASADDGGGKRENRIFTSQSGSLKRKRRPPTKLVTDLPGPVGSSASPIGDGEGSPGIGKRKRTLKPSCCTSASPTSSTGGTYTGTADSLLKIIDTL